MKTVTRRYIALILTFVMCLGMIFGINVTAYADNVDYVKDGKYIYNWGTREEVATFLSQNAIAFYEDNGTTYAKLSALAGSNVESSIPSSALYKELQNLMKSNHSYINSYDKIKSLCKYTDCQNSGGRISSFYSGAEIGPDWDGAWNREHTWPNSKGDKAGSGENDIMMIRPTADSENFGRGNKAYGQNSGYYNPNSESNGAYDLRGDVARIMLYQYVRWNCTKASNNNGNWYSIFGTNGVIESKELMLEWIEEDPVDTWELGRNDSVESITGTRNVFVDYPELAFILFGEQVPSDYTTPSGNAKNGTTPAPTPTPDNGNQNDTQNNNQNNSQNNTQNNTQSNSQNNTQNNTQNSTQNNNQNNTQSNSSTASNACRHAKAYKVAAEEPRCETEGYTEGRYCPDCKNYISGHKAISATGHSYAGECDAICDVCNATREIDAQHTFDDEGNCTVCGEADIQNPDANDDIVDGTEDEIQDTDSNEQASEKGGFAWWIIVVVAVVIVGASAVVIVIYRDKIWPKEN